MNKENSMGTLMNLLTMMLIVTAFVTAGCAPASNRTIVFDCSKEDCQSCDIVTSKISDARLTQEICARCQNLSTSCDGGSCDAADKQKCEAASLPKKNDNAYFIRGCNSDGDCSQGMCGHFTAVSNLCVTSDAK